MRRRKQQSELIEKLIYFRRNEFYMIETNRNPNFNDWQKTTNHSIWYKWNKPYSVGIEKCIDILSSKNSLRFGSYCSLTLLFFLSIIVPTTDQWWLAPDEMIVDTLLLCSIDRDWYTYMFDMVKAIDIYRLLSYSY